MVRFNSKHIGSNLFKQGQIKLDWNAKSEMNDAQVKKMMK